LVRWLVNPLLMFGARLGVSVRGSRVLEVRGRKSGVVRRTPVNLLSYEGQQYLVAPRGDTHWARNVRADSGRLVLVLGRRRQERVATELTDAHKPPVLRAYLRRWKVETGVFFEGVGASSSDEELLEIAPKHPVFVLNEVDAGAAPAS
jgi:hypothetical protein